MIGGVANNECLPFKDGTFDCYLAGLSLMLVDNYRNQLKEALRVKQSGGSLGFTVWGRKENTHFTTILGRVLGKYGIHLPKGAKTPFDISQDPEALAKEMRSLGFTDIRMWYQASNF